MSDFGINLKNQYFLFFHFRSVYLVVAPFFNACCVLYVTAPLFSSSDYPLPWEMWIPFKLNKYNYPLVYFVESVRAMYSGISSTAHDLLFFSLSMRGCHQMELLKHRFHEYPNNVRLIMKNNWNQSRYDAERILLIDIIRHLKMIRL